MSAGALAAASLRASERPADDLMRAEYKHRTANLLQLVSLNLASLARRAQDEFARKTLEQAAEQVTGVGQLLHSLEANESSWPEDAVATLRPVCTALDVLVLRPAGRGLTFRAEAKELMVRPTLARCLAMIVTELVLNAAKHAFGGRKGGQVTVSIVEVQHHLVCTVRDDGGGMRPIAARGTSQGLALAEALAVEAGGHCRWLFTKLGTLAEVSLPFDLPSATSEPLASPKPSPPWWKLIRGRRLRHWTA